MFDGGRRAGATFLKFVVVITAEFWGRLRRRIAISSGRLRLITLVGIHGAPSVARTDRQVYINILYIYISLRAAFAPLAPRYIYRKHNKYIWAHIHIYLVLCIGSGRGLRYQLFAGATDRGAKTARRQRVGPSGVYTRRAWESTGDALTQGERRVLSGQLISI